MATLLLQEIERRAEDAARRCRDHNARGQWEMASHWADKQNTLQELLDWWAKQAPPTLVTNPKEKP